MAPSCSRRDDRHPDGPGGEIRVKPTKARTLVLTALISAESDEIVEFTALGTQAGELMAVVQIAMLAKLPYTVLRDAILTHPTMAEGLITLFAAVPPIRG